MGDRLLRLEREVAAWEQSTGEMAQALADALGAPIVERHPSLGGGLADYVRTLARERDEAREEEAHLRRVLHEVAVRGADPACATCGGYGSAPDGETCVCFGWRARSPEVPDAD